MLDAPMLSRMRRNHGLEHATLHVLADKFPDQNLAGHSSPKGFWIVGNVTTQAVNEAVQEAFQRLAGGEKDLAVHQNCGTNFATAGSLAGIAGAAAMFGAGRRWRDKLERLPLAATLATLALIISQPIGKMVQQRVTTSGDLGTLEVAEIKYTKRGGITAHQIITKG
jgi:hypothetical protein